VVEEIYFLYHKKGCSVFLFEDDDFPVRTVNGSDWLEKFCNELKDRNLADKIMWKINCRPDEVDYDRFALMKKHGLYLVFLGIDDGTDSGLKLLNKHMTVTQSLKGINTLKTLEIGFDYGFMLFQPATTFGSVNHNLDFLRQLCGDGTTPVSFLKLRPYFDTSIEMELKKEGRLKGKEGYLDYDFFSDSLNCYYKFISESFMEWLTDPEGLGNILKWAKNYFSVFSHYYKITPEVQSLSAQNIKCIAQSNMFLLDTLKELSGKFEKGKYCKGRFSELAAYKNNIKEEHDKYKEQTGKCVMKVSRIAEYQRLSEQLNR
jgi:radical SAM superfamily enzyme YgiQ (UPF0313 family)